jgi:hypothetical protein
MDKNYAILICRGKTANIKIQITAKTVTKLSNKLEYILRIQPLPAITVYHHQPCTFLTKTNNLLFSISSFKFEIIYCSD